MNWKIKKEAKKMKQCRWKSPIFWTGIISIIAMGLKTFGIYEIDNHTLDIIINLVLSLLSAFGVANNPTDKTNF